MTGRGATWLDRCAAFARTVGTAEAASALPALDAFGAGVAIDRSALPFEALDAHAAGGVDARAQAIVDACCHEVDRPQAAMFARRYRAVATLLGTLATSRPAGRLLRVGLEQRLGEILADPRPRALRVRAAVDFYYSQAAILHYAGSGGTVAERVAAARWRTVRDGLEHGVVEGMTAKGPVHVNVLRIAPGAARLTCVDCREEGAGVSLPDVARAHRAIAAVSGGFFLYSEPDIAPPFRRHDPVGLLVHTGQVQVPPFFRRAALLVRDGHPSVARVGLLGAQVAWPGGEAWVAAVNGAAAHGTEAGAGGGAQRRGEPVVAYTRAHCDVAPASPGDRVAVGPAAALPGAPAVPLAGAVLVFPGATTLRPGMPLRWELATPADEAMAGGPLLLTGGLPCLDMAAEDFTGGAPPLTFSRDETFDQNQLPRMAAGLTADGTLLLAAIDGRNFDRALGLTLHEAAALMAQLGCTVALNLDGGSSKRMVVEGRVVDIPSTDVVAGDAETPVRPVHTAVLVG